MKRQINYRDLKVVDKAERKAFMKSLEDTMDNGMFMMGEAVSNFEKKFASYCSRSHAIGVSSGTSGLILALKALSIGPGDEVITTSMSWLATANVIILRGATPVFVDVDDDLNINSKEVESAINSKTKAILAVHFCGRICEIQTLRNIADKHGLFLIEDASQAAGATFDRKKAGFWGDVSAFSLNPMKPLGALGEAGVVLTDDKKIVGKICSLRYLGTEDIEFCEDPDLNHKIDELQALWLMERLKKLDKILNKRRSIATYFSETFPEEVRIIGIEDLERTTFFEFTIEVDKRNELQEYLKRELISSRVKHPVLVCDQPGYSKEYIEEIPNARRLINKILSLPLYNSLTDKQCEHISKSLKSFFKKDSKPNKNKLEGLFYQRQTCRLCESSNLKNVLSLGESPLCDAYIPKEINQPSFNLDLFSCTDCNFVQINTVIDSNEIYGDYMYLTSSASQLVDHFKSYAKEVRKALNLDSSNFIVDIGSNDGTLLGFFKDFGHKTLGIEPSMKAASFAERKGVNTLIDYFNLEVARHIKEEHGKAKLITINNTLANVDNLEEFTKALKVLLDSDGVVIVESSYLFDMLDNVVFDFIYHEHMSYFSILPLKRFLENHDLKLIKVQRVGTKGGSLRYFFTHKDSRRKVDSSVKKMIEKEIVKLQDENIFSRFKTRIDSLGRELIDFLNKNEGKEIVGYGASATSTTLISYFGLDKYLTYLVDDFEDKLNTFSPGFHIPVFSPDKIKENPPDVILILAWRYKDEIIKKISGSNQIIAIPLPEFSILKNK